MDKAAKADVAHIRQTTQFTCCAASIASCLNAHAKEVTEDEVNRILSAAPMSGATWEAIMATLQYFGLRGTLVIPSTPRMLKEWTDQGIPVIIGWNPEGRPWSHASVVYDVTEGETGLTIHVMDPNIPNPSKTTRSMHEDEFCQKWSEKMSDTLYVCRPACAVTREVSVEGRQMTASMDRYVDDQGRGRDDEGNTWTNYHPTQGVRKSPRPDMGMLKQIQELLKTQPHNNFLNSVYRQYQTTGSLSPKQTAAIVRMMKQASRSDIMSKEKDPKILKMIQDLLKVHPHHKFYTLLLEEFQATGSLSPKQIAILENVTNMMKQASRSDIMAREKDPRDTIKIKQEDIVRRNPVQEAMLGRNYGTGKFHNRGRDVEKGRSRKPKHKKRDDREAAMIERVASRYQNREE